MAAVGKTQEGELSSIEKSTPIKIRDQITADQREQRFQIAATCRLNVAVPPTFFNKCATRAEFVSSDFQN